MTPITDRQQEVLDFLTERAIARNPPTHREIGVRIGVTSPNCVSQHLAALERKGLITTEKGKSRSIQLVNDPWHRLFEAADALIKRYANPLPESLSELQLAVEALRRTEETTNVE